MSAAFWFNVVVGGLMTGLVYGLAALGLTLVFAVNRTANLLHGALMLAGMVLAAGAAARGTDPLLVLPPLAAGLFGAGFGLQRLVIARTEAAPVPVRTLLLTGLAFAGFGAVVLAWGPDGARLHLPPPASGADTLGVGPVLLDRLRVRAALIAMMATALLFMFFNVGSTGRAIRACADDPLGARVIGLDLERLRAVTYGLGAAVTGVAGALLGQIAEVRPALAADYTVLSVVVALIGGFGSVGGALLAGLMVGVAETLAGAVLGGAFKGAFAGALLVLMLALRPAGLLGAAE